MTNKLFDSQCRELADHFLADAAKEEAVSDETRNDLAQAIQDAVEDWFISWPHVPGSPPSAPPEGSAMTDETTEEDYAEIGRSLVERMPKGYVYSENPAEIVTNLLNELYALRQPKPRANYHEYHGPVLWWRFPIVEPPYCGRPGDSDWPESDDYTHWTPIPLPELPASAEAPHGD